MRPRHILSVAVSCVATLAAAAACGSGGNAASSKTITVAYEEYGTFHAAGDLFKKIAPTFEKQHPGWKVQLVPIDAPENDYYTKLDLMNRSSSTAPDVLYEDTFLINSDVQAGYLAPLNSYVNSWPDWSQFFPASRKAVQAANGDYYGVPMSTDTRGLWYNKQIFAKAGLPVPWHPKTWADVLAAARAIKQKDPGVIPLNVYSGTPAGEATTMQGFEMLLYGTGETLFDKSTRKWIPPGTGFTNSLSFIKTIYDQGLAPKPEQELNPNIATTINAQWLPQGKLAIDLDGSWLPGTAWTAGNPNPWPKWSSVMGWTTMPTQNGQGSDITTMSGGWALSVGSSSPHKSMAFDLIELALNKQNSIYYAQRSGDLAVRQDVANDPAYDKAMPGLAFWTNLVKYTNYRPANTVYPRLSNEIQQATESVMTGQASAQQAASTYGQSLKQIAGPSNVEGG
ncbi:MAG TPA: extracellular solute-binding protein [Streptosporangiaceae bacterium]|nr:extracellular solute-binding protein [Streptosporangiaceae bacterium]